MLLVNRDLGRSLISISSTVLSSATNVVVQLVAAIYLSAQDFTAFGIGAATVLTVLGFGNMLIGQLDLIRGKRGPDSSVAGFSLLCAIFCVIIGAATLAAGNYLGNSSIAIIGYSVIISSVFVVKDSIRFRAFRVEQPHWALLSDMLVLVATAVCIVGLNARSLGPYQWLALWGAATALGLAIAIYPLKYWGRLSEARDWWDLNRSYIVTGGLDYLMVQVVPYLMNFVIIAVGGALAFAGYRVVQLIFASLGNLSQGLNAFELPRVSANPSRDVLQGFQKRSTILLMAPALLLTIAIALLPVDMGISVFGDTWLGVDEFLLVGAFHGTVNAIALPNSHVLKLLGDLRFILKIRTVSSILSPLAGLALGFIWGAVGVAWGVALVAFLVYLARVLRVMKLTAAMSSDHNPASPIANG